MRIKDVGLILLLLLTFTPKYLYPETTKCPPATLFLDPPTRIQMINKLTEFPHPVLIRQIIIENLPNPILSPEQITIPEPILEELKILLPGYSPDWSPKRVRKEAREYIWCCFIQLYESSE